MEIRNRWLLAYSPILKNSSAKCLGQGNVHTGCDANGTISEVIRKKSMPWSTLYERIFKRHKRFAFTVSLTRSSEYDARRNVREGEHPIDRLIQG
jgi:hypothetical protein